jgi:hypothetical protein
LVEGNLPDTVFTGKAFATEITETLRVFHPITAAFASHILSTTADTAGWSISSVNPW